MDLLAEVAKTIEKYTLLSPGERVLVGVSGGADSLCLMHCLDRLGYEVIVAHLDHQLRAESCQDAAYVRKIAAAHPLQLVMERTQNMLRSGSIEEAGRIYRYSFFLRIAIEMGLKSIAVGHSADDQSETILMHFLRGTGPEGLRGMLPKRSMAQWGDTPQSGEINLIRPLLKMPRSMIETYCLEVGLEPLQDPSNQDVSFTRSRIRHEILPLLIGINPRLNETLQRMADIMHAEVEFFDEILVDDTLGLGLREDENGITFNRGAFLLLHPALQRVFLRRFLVSLSSQNETIGFEAVENTVQFLSSSGGWGAMDFGKDLQLQRFSETAVIRKGFSNSFLSSYPQLAATLKLELGAGYTVLGEGWRIKASQEKVASELQQEIVGNQDRSKAFLDAAVIRKSPLLRVQMAGDRFQPLGMTGSIKLSDYFINLKIPRPARKNWPLFATEDEIFWVVGCQIADRFRMRNKSKHILRLELLSD